MEMGVGTSSVLSIYPSKAVILTLPNGNFGSVSPCLLNLQKCPVYEAAFVGFEMAKLE